MTAFEIVPRGLLIGGSWRDRASGGLHAIRAPYDGRVVGQVPFAGASEVREAMDSAVAAFARETLTPTQRSAILRSAAVRVRDRVDELARLLALESGKPMTEARGEVGRTATVLEEAAEEARRISGHMVAVDAVPGSEDRIAFTIRAPLGVVGAITPFNGPLLSPAHKVGSAIAAGNVVVLKPASATPLSALELAAALVEAGLPADFLQVLVGGGNEIGDAIVDDPRLAMVSFTGSTAVGLRIRERLGVRRATLELGGNAPLIVHDDADIEAAARAAVAGAFGYAGQVCISVQRILVQERMRSRFEAAFLPRVEALRVGDPLDESTDVGPMLSEAKALEAEASIEAAVRVGAQRLTQPRREGALLWPTVLADADMTLPVVCQEAFAPVVNLHSYGDFDEAIDLANSTDYGLQAGIFTSSLGVALDAARRLQFGGVIVNDTSRYRVDRMPYGGTKSSGLGKEGPRYAIEEMTEERLVVLKGVPA
jgi:acyl-CoA reductase-like NAD-dependent aldehyde dehydrogenase